MAGERSARDVCSGLSSVRLDGHWALDVAIYEYELQAIVDAVNAAFERGVKVRVLYHAQPGEDTTALNEASLEKIPAANKRGRVTHNIFHDKFIVLSKARRDGATSARRRCCAAAPTSLPTAFTARPTSFMCWTTPASAPVICTPVRATLGQPYGCRCHAQTGSHEKQPHGFADSRCSPVSRRALAVGDLRSRLSRSSRRARKDVLFVTAFALPERHPGRLARLAQRRNLRYGLQNTNSRITGFHADRTAEFAATAQLNTGLQSWLREEHERGQIGNLLVHTKAVVDGLHQRCADDHQRQPQPQCRVRSMAMTNYLIIRGDTDLADRYGLELLRFCEHYRFRYFARKLAAQAGPSVGGG